MFAVIHNGSVAVKDKDGNVYPGDQKDCRPKERMDGKMWIDFDGDLDLLPILEHGQKYLVELIGGAFSVATFNANNMTFEDRHLFWKLKHIKGFSPLPEMIEI